MVNACIFVYNYNTLKDIVCRVFREEKTRIHYELLHNLLITAKKLTTYLKSIYFMYHDADKWMYNGTIILTNWRLKTQMRKVFWVLWITSSIMINSGRKILFKSSASLLKKQNLIHTKHFRNNFNTNVLTSTVFVHYIVFKVEYW